jgi:biotin carboxyl carrier protein
MKYFITIRGESFEVDLGVTRDGTTPASHDGVDHRLDLHPVDGLERCAVAVDGRVHDVLLGEDARGMHVTLDGVRHDVGIEDERERAAHLTARPAASGPVTVKSAMPGILRAILVKVGDAVAAGAPLAILEAMKMENEIRADHAGVVREIKVQAGVAVDGGADLILLDPPRTT